jgi:hypothetical protein
MFKSARLVIATIQLARSIPFSRLGINARFDKSGALLMDGDNRSDRQSKLVARWRPGSGAFLTPL